MGGMLSAALVHWATVDASCRLHTSLHQSRDILPAVASLFKGVPQCDFTAASPLRPPFKSGGQGTPQILGYASPLCPPFKGVPECDCGAGSPLCPPFKSSAHATPQILG